MKDVIIYTTVDEICRHYLIKTDGHTAEDIAVLHQVVITSLELAEYRGTPENVAAAKQQFTLLAQQIGFNLIFMADDIAPEGTVTRPYITERF